MDTFKKITFNHISKWLGGNLILFLKLFFCLFRKKGKILHQRGIYWWGNSLLLVGNLIGLMGILRGK